MHQPVVNLSLITSISASLLVGLSACATGMNQSTLSVKAIQAVVASDTAYYTAAGNLLVIDTSYLQSMGLNSQAAIQLLAEAIDPRIRLGIPSVDSVCGSHSQLRCARFRILTFELTGMGAILRAEWVMYHPGRCADSWGARYTLRRIGDGISITSVDEVDHGFCGIKPP